MREQEQQEKPVVVKANAAVEPDAMVVELLDTYSTKRAVFRTRRLWLLAGATLYSFLKEHPIEWVFFHTLSNVALLDDSGISPAGQQERDVPQYHDSRAQVLVIVGNVGAGDVFFEAYFNVNVKGAESEDHVNYLDDWVALIANIVEEGFNDLHEPSAA